MRHRFIRRASQLSLAGGMAVLFLVAAPMLAGAASPNPSAPPQAGAAATAVPQASNSGCPSGTVFYQPTRPAGVLASEPAVALPAGFSTLANAPVVKEAIAEHVAWLSSISCTLVPSSPIVRPLPSGDLGTATASPGAAGGGATRDISQLESTNWSGYLAKPAPSITSVNGRWKVPALLTPPSAGAQAVMTVFPGMGQGTSSQNQLAQAGLEENYVNGGAEYTGTMWIEIYPQEAQVNVDNLPITPGDSVGVTVGYNGLTHTAAFLLVNFTEGQAVEGTQTVNGAVGTKSAEWIVERPAVCSGSSCAITPLAAFGSVKFNHAEALSRSTILPASSLATTRINMFSCNRALLAKTALFSSPTAFKITWKGFGEEDPFQC